MYSTALDLVGGYIPDSDGLATMTVLSTTSRNRMSRHRGEMWEVHKDALPNPSDGSAGLMPKRKTIIWGSALGHW